VMAHARKRAKRLKVALIPKRERNGRAQRVIGRRRESEADVLAVALSQPHRRDKPEPRDELLGSALGRLRRADAITLAQFDAGKVFASVAMRYMRDVLAHSPRVRGLDLAAIGGKGCGDEPSERDIWTARTNWSDVQSAMRDTREARESLEALTVVCVLDEDPTHATLGHLRVGLNALHRLWG
jgi:hypothetical protein